MELSSEILESLVMDNKDVMEVLKDENVTEEDIIFESEVTAEDSEETEIEEIIEIIEEIEEEGDETPPDDDASDKDKSTDVQNTEIAEKTKRNDKPTSKNIELYGFDEESSIFTSQLEKESAKNVKSNTQKTTKKQVINYDVDEDWEDEELERVDALDNNSEASDDRASSLRTQADKKHVNNQTILLQSNRLDLKIHVDSTGKTNKSRGDSGIGNKVNNTEADSESTQEIVKNTENNLVYTVLGTKKQDSSSKQQQEKQLGDQYVKVSISDQSIVNDISILLTSNCIILDGTT